RATHGPAGWRAARARAVGDTGPVWRAFDARGAVPSLPIRGARRRGGMARRRRPRAVAQGRSKPLDAGPTSGARAGTRLPPPDPPRPPPRAPPPALPPARPPPRARIRGAMSPAPTDKIRAAATALGALGAAKGGRARAARMAPEEGSAQARRAVLVRWKRRRQAVPTSAE